MKGNEMTDEELLTEMEKVTMELVQLYKSDKDLEEVEEELEEKSERVEQLGEEWNKRPNFLETILSKQIKVVQANMRLDEALEDRLLAMREKVSENRQKELNNIVERGDLEAGEFFQVEMLRKLEQMSLDNSQSNAKSMKRSIDNNVRIVQLQAGMVNILDKVEKNTSTWRQFGLVVAASAVVAISVGFVVDVIFLRWNGEIKEHWLLAILWAIGVVGVIGLVFAGLEIRKRVKKNRRLL